MSYRSRRSSNQRRRHLDARGPRDVVYCHQCEHEWFVDDYGLECPSCDGNITEIVVPGADDPRRMAEVESPHPPPGELEDWSGMVGEQPSSRISELSRPFRTRRTFNPHSTSETPNNREIASNDLANNIMVDVQTLVSSLLGPQLQHSEPGRSRSEILYNQPTIQTSSFRFGNSEDRHSIVGSRITISNTFTHDRSSRQPRDHNEDSHDDITSLNDLFSMVVNLIGLDPDSNQGGAAHRNGDTVNSHSEGFNLGPFLSALQSGYAHLGDAVHSQEAFDLIISNFMENNTSSNAPGPASPEAIAALPRKKLDTRLLGPEGKGECSICIDEVKVGDEVLVLPCNHWFDETCATAWLKEHNTCPICRKGISENAISPKSPSSQRPRTDNAASRSNNRSQRYTSTHSGASQENRIRNEERLNSLRSVAGVSLPEETFQTTRHQRPDRTTGPSSESSTAPSRRTMPGNNGSSGRGTFLRFLTQDRSNNNRRNL